MLLAQNEGALTRAGFLFPHMGRPVRLLGSEIAGHHNLAWDLLGDGRFERADGSLAEMIAEIERAELPIVLLSSEDFALCYDRVHALPAIRDALRAIGYDPHALVYLRPQRGYAQSLYTELVKQGAPLGFERFLEDILRDGAFSISGYTMPFDYTILVDALVSCFGADRTIVRPYFPGATPDVLPRDYVDVVRNGLPLDLARLIPAGTQNAAATYREIVRALYVTLGSGNEAMPDPVRLEREAFTSDEAHLLDVTFAPLNARDDEIIQTRFADSNGALAERFGFTWGADPVARDQPRQRAFLERAFATWSAA